MDISINDFKYVDTAIGDVSRRNNPIEVSKLKSLLNGHNIDCYRTYFQYPYSFVEHVKATASTSGYDGPCYSKYIPIDIDSTDLTEALERTRRILRHLEDTFILDLNLLPLFFSGAKGFHIMLPTKLFGIKPAKDLDKVYRRIVEAIIPPDTKVDNAIYDKVRLLRIANTIHSITNLYKIPISVQEVFNLDIDSIQELAIQPRNEKFWDEDCELNEKLQKEYLKALNPSQSKTLTTQKKYERLLDQEVIEGDRNNSLTSMAGMLSAKNVNKQTALPILQSLNLTKCSPPLPDYELNNIIESVYKDQTKEGYSFKPTNIANFMGKQAPIINWIVDGLIVEGAVVLLVAKPKVGKSILALNFALAVSRGEPIFNKNTNKGKALYIALEDRERLVQSRLWNILGKPNELGLDIFCGDISLDKENFREKIKQSILSNDYKLVVIDPLIEAYRGADENNPNEMAKLLSFVREIAQGTNASILLVHHARKSEGDGGDIIRGSSAIWSGVDGSIILKPFPSDDNFKRVSMEAILRDAESGEKAIIKLNDSLSWELEGLFEEYEIKSTSEKIKEYLEEGEATIKEVSIGINVYHETVRKSLQRMYVAGDVNRRPLGTNRNSGHKYFLSHGMSHENVPREKVIDIEDLDKLFDSHGTN